MTPVDEAESIARRYMDLCNTGDAASIGGCFTADAVIYDLNVPPVKGAEAIGQFWVRVRDRWEGGTWSIIALVSDGRTVAVEWDLRGRRHGEPILFRGADMITVEAGRISEVHQYWSYQPETGSDLVGYRP
jgi:ketosteroid isomerase-like protein